ncbi:MAG: family transcriptional regulator, cyclic receptor protein [Pseudonocardiales bacterium]|jgi:CRP-like cAMP-binding protein|nr:family transcriptional regulator, cyclic receptor protein [Pseudonocardiales bacterium]
MLGRTKRPSANRLATLRAVPMFSGLSDAALGRIDGRVVEIDVDAGTVLMREGEPGREAFVIGAGRAEIRVGGDAVSSVSAGDLVGETSLLDGGPRTATVVALTPLRLYVVSPSEFAALFEDPQAARWIAATLARRLRTQRESRLATASA